MLIKYDHATLKPTRLTLQMPALEKKKETKRVWSYGGKTDSTITLLQHNEEYKKTKIRILTINITSGASSEFYYEPGLDNINISPFATDRFRDGSGGNWNQINITSFTGGSYPWTAYGNIVPIEGETGYYFYALGSFTNKKANDPRPDGFILTKLDAEGRELWSTKQEVKEEEVDNTFYRNHRVPGAMVIYLNQFKEERALSVEITYQKTDVVTALSTIGQGRIGYRYDQNGKLLEQCVKNTKQKLMSGKSSVEQSEDLMPCFSTEKTKQIITYLNSKKPEGSFSVIAGKQAHVLVVMPKQEKEPVQCLYFKN